MQLTDFLPSALIWPANALLYNMVYIPESISSIARTSLVAFEAIKPFWTHSFLAINPFKSRITQTRSVYVVTLCTILAVTPLCALEAICPNRTLFLTPATKYERQDPIKHYSLVCLWLLHRHAFVNELSTESLLIYLSNLVWTNDVIGVMWYLGHVNCC